MKRNIRSLTPSVSFQSIFTTNIQNNIIRLDNVVLKETHVLRKFSVSNLSEFPLKIQLKTDLPQVKFQIENENYQDVNEDEVFSPIQADHFNQLFNDINLIEEFRLGPRRTQNVILSFRPMHNVVKEESSESDEEEKIGTSDNLNNYTTVQGHIHLSAVSEEDFEAHGERELTLRFIAMICKSILKVDRNDLTFEECVREGTYVKDFTLWNCSEMPLSFFLSYKASTNLPHVLEFFDNETGLPLSIGNPNHVIPGYYHIPVRISFKPLDIGEFEFTVKIENTNDSNNVEQIAIRAVVFSTPQQFTESIIAPEKIVFEDCYTGIRAFQVLSLRNITEQPIDVHFESDSSQEVSFSLYSDEKNKTDTDSDNDDYSKPTLLDKNDSKEELIIPQTPPKVSTYLSISPHKKDSPMDGRIFSTRVDDPPPSAIEELTINPGQERNIKVWYCPSRQYEEDVKTSQEKIQYYVETYARTCTSLIEVPKSEIDLGDCHVGSEKSGVFEVVNMSDLPAEVSIEYQSKVIRFKQSRFTIPPRQGYFCTFDFVPRHPSSQYRKQITLINMKNAQNDQFIQVMANNIDLHRFAYHAKFYRIITPLFRDYIDFESSIINSPNIRSFTIKNISKKILKLKISSLLPDEIKLYTQGYPVSAVPSASPFREKRKELLIKTIEEKQFASTTKSQNHQYLDLAAPPTLNSERKVIHEISPITSRNVNDVPIQTDALSPTSPAHGHSEVAVQLHRDLNSLVKLFQQRDSIPVFADVNQEEQYCLREISKLEAIHRALNEGILIPVSNLEILAEQETNIFVIFVPIGSKRPSVKGKLRKFDSKILIELLETQDGTTEKERIHELSVTANICRSIMDLAQKSINFGVIQKDDHKAKTLVINNLSEVPLIYNIRKSGSMASLDLNFSKEDKIGLIRPYRNKEVHFFFKPSLSEPYHERLMIDNVLDISNNQLVHVKANVMKRTNFFLKSLELDFLTVAVGELSDASPIVITNTSKKAKVFTIEAAENNFEFVSIDFKFSLEKEPPVDGIARLIKSGDNIIRFSLNGGATVKVLARALAKRGPQQQRKISVKRIEDVKGEIFVYESKDSDASKKMVFIATVRFDGGHAKHKSLSFNGPTLGNNNQSNSLTLSPASVKSIAASLSPPSFLDLSPKSHDFGEITLGKQSSSQFSIVNISSKTIPFSIILRGTSQENIFSALKGARGGPVANQPRHPIFKFSKQKGEIEPNGTITIRFSCVPVNSGPQTHTILVRNLNNMLQSTMSVKMVALKPQYIKFPEIESTSEQLVIDLGKCYIDNNKNYSRVAPITIESVYKQPLLITVQSNLTNQVFVFQDSQLTKPASVSDNQPDILLKPLGATTVFVCLKMKSESYNRGICRELVGGIKVRVFDPNNFMLDEITLKFTAVVGKSILELDPAFIDLGTTRRIGHKFFGTFTLRNITTLLPSEYRIESSNATNIKLSAYNGRLDGSEITNGISFHEISFTLSSTSHGLRQETLSIINENNSEQNLQLGIRLFVDDGSLVTDLEKNGENKLFFKDLLYVETQSFQEAEQKKSSLQCSTYYFNLSDLTNSTLTKYQRSLLIMLENKLFQDVFIYPKSNLNVVVVWKDYNEEEFMNPEYNRTDYTSPANDFHLCGKPFLLKARHKIPVHICVPTPVRLSSPKFSTLVQGKKAIFRGAVTFEREIDAFSTLEDSPESLMRVSKLIGIQGSYCLSIANVVPDVIDVGKIGFENRWNTVPFQFEVKNPCDSQLVYKFDIPRGINLSLSSTVLNKDDILVIEPYQSQQLQASLSPLKLGATTGPFTSELKISNLNNPLNKPSLIIRAEISACPIKIDDNNEITLPTLFHPSQTTSDSWFIIENTRDKSLDVILRSEISAELSTFVTIELISRQANQILNSSFSLSTAEQLEVLVRMKPNNFSRLPQRFIHSDQQFVTIGKISAVTSNNTLLETITLKGSFAPGQTFSLSTTRLHFDYALYEDMPVVSIGQRGTFAIKNQLAFPLSYEINPAKFSDKLKLSIVPQSGTIPPEEQQVIEITVTASEQLSESINLTIFDTKSTSITQNVIMSIVAEKKQKAPIKRRKRPSLDSEELSTLSILPRITLKGCTPIAEDNARYEINLGQQTFQSGNVTWDLTIENVSDTKVEYKIYAVNREDESWLSLSRNYGVIESRKESHNVTITCSTKKMDIYTGYLIIENLSNPQDLKTVRVSFKVVGQSTNQLFGVVINGMKSNNSVLDLGDVYYGMSYHDFSFVITNDSSTPLDFLMSTNLRPDDSTSLNFSLTRTSVNLVNFITIDAQNSQKLFLDFRPISSAPPNSQNENIKEEKVIEIYINCRLVKDYRQVITLKAKCGHPQLHVAKKALTFIGNPIWKKREVYGDDNSKKSLKDTDLIASDIDIPKEQGSKHILIANNSNSILEYVIQNDSMFFLVEGAKEAAITSRYITHSFTVTINRPVVLSNKEVLLKEKYIEEHITIYNKNQLTERYWIAIRLTLGHLVDFFSAPTAQHSFPFLTLEGLTVNFIRDFKSFWNDFAERQRLLIPKSKDSLLDFIANLNGLEDIDDSHIYFAFHYIVDELLFFGLKKQSSKFSFQVANLLFTTLFKHEIFVPLFESARGKKTAPNNFVELLSKWIKPLSYFLVYFPEQKQPLLVILRNLETELRPIIEDQREEKL